MNKIQPELIRRVADLIPPKKWSGFPVLVAVSGGADSVALLRILIEIRRAEGRSQSKKPDSAEHSDRGSSPSTTSPAPLIVGHVNHRLRGNESNQDQQFVSELAAKFGLECEIENLSQPIFPGSEISNSEETLRDARYEALQRMARRVGARYLATGHTQDDQVETILFRILRGTGPNGLGGIPAVRRIDESLTVIRPLLKISREQVEVYVKEIGQPFRTDGSNADSKYTRNYLRNELLPQIRERFGDSVGSSLLSLGKQSQEMVAFINSHEEKLNDAIMGQSPEWVELDCSRLRAAEPLLVRQFLNRIWVEQNWSKQAMGYQWWNKICDAIQGPQVKLVLNLPGPLRFEKKEGVVRIFSVA